MNKYEEAKNTLTRIQKIRYEFVDLLENNSLESLIDEINKLLNEELEKAIISAYMAKSLANAKKNVISFQK